MLWSTVQIGILKQTEIRIREDSPANNRLIIVLDKIYVKSHRDGKEVGLIIIFKKFLCIIRKSLE